MTSLSAMRRAPWRLMLVALATVSASTPPIPQETVASSEQQGPAAMGREDIADTLLEWNPRLGPLRAVRIADAVLRCEADHGLPSQLVLAIMKRESTARPWAKSPKGAVGLMQVMPHMFEQLDLPGSIAHLDTNIEAGCILLADNVQRRGLKDGVSTYFWGSRIRGDRYWNGVKGVLENELEFDVDSYQAANRS